MCSLKIFKTIRGQAKIRYLLYLFAATKFASIAATKKASLFEQTAEMRDLLADQVNCLNK